MIGKLTWHTLYACLTVAVLAFGWQALAEGDGVGPTLASLGTVVGLGG
jgi:hypothetical protein